MLPIVMRREFGEVSLQPKDKYHFVFIDVIYRDQNCSVNTFRSSIPIKSISYCLSSIPYFHDESFLKYLGAYLWRS
jgi:hypothetical protein